MRFISLFSGIGGLDLGLERAGWTPVAFCEQDLYCRWVLGRKWPRVPCFDDVRTLDPSCLGEIDAVVGGFPCQDISVAGKGEGLSGERSGLWWEMYRVIDLVRPRWVIAENVPRLRTLGADAVLESLEGIGYTCWPIVVGADDIGAPHRRKRVFIIARLADQHDRGRRTLRPPQTRQGIDADRGHDGLADIHGVRPPTAGEVDSKLRPVQGVDCVADTDREGPGRNGIERDRPNTDRSHAGLAHAPDDHGGQGIGGQEEGAGAGGSGGRGPASGGRGLADAVGGPGEFGTTIEGREPERRAAVRGRVYVFPPRPDDYAGWAGVLRVRPDLAPAQAEPGVCRVADGVPRKLARRHWRAQLRGFGNAVVPAVGEVIGEGINRTEAQLTAHD